MRRMPRFGRLLAALGGAGGVIGLVACGAAVPAAQTTHVDLGTAATIRARAADPATADASGTAASGTAGTGTAGTGATGGAIPQAGNPGGHAYVPPAGRAVNTSHPNHVIGHGTPASCTSAAVVRAVAAGGIITFHCGPH